MDNPHNLEELASTSIVRVKLLTPVGISLVMLSPASVSYGQVETINYTNGDVEVGE